MPHQCTSCGRTFPDGSKEMLSGCPDCSGTKFQFQPDGFEDGDAASGVDDRSGASGADDRPAASNTDDRSVASNTEDRSSASNTEDRSSAPVADGSATPTSGTAGVETSGDSRNRPGDTVSRTVGSAAATVRDLVSGSAGPDATAATPRSESTAESESTADSPSTSTSDTHAKSTGASGTDSGAGDDIIVAECEPVDDGEDTAQADARSSFVNPDEVPESDGFDPTGDAGEDETPAVDQESVADETRASGVGASSTSDADAPSTSDAGESSTDRTVVDEPDAERADRPDVAELREELNQQFESIRVVEPGQYELNLMELYDREEYIIALQEDGRYSIQVPETWRDADE